MIVLPDAWAHHSATLSSVQENEGYPPLCDDFRHGLLSDTDMALKLGVSKDVEYFVYHNRAVANYELKNCASAASDAKKSLAAPYSGSDKTWRADVYWISFLANEQSGEGLAAHSALTNATLMRPELAKNLDCGFIRVVNKTNRKIAFCPDYWIGYDDAKTDLNSSWITKGTEYYWVLDPGETCFPHHNGHPFRAKKKSQHG